MQPEKVARIDTDIYLIGELQHQIVDDKLPSNRQVLSVFFFNTRLLGHTKEESVRLVVKEVEVFWEKAKIPTSKSDYCGKKVMKLYEEYRSLQKTVKQPHKSKNFLEAEKKFTDNLENLFDISSMNAIKNLDVEVKEFLLLQRQKGRPGTFPGINEQNQEKEERRLKRIEDEENRKRKWAADKQKQCKFYFVD